MFFKAYKATVFLPFISTLLCTSITVQAAPQKIQIAVTQRLANLYQSAIEHNQKNITDFNELDLKNKTKGFASLIILKQALHQAGLATTFEFVISPTYKRSQLLVQKGIALLTLSTLLENYTPPGTFKSSVLIGSNDMARGIYGLKSNHALFKIKTLDELKKLTAVTNIAWGGDIEKLQKIKPAKLDLVYNLKTIFMHIAYRNTDFTLLDLPSGKLELYRKHENVVLFPVPGLFINTNTSRHFLFSQIHPDSKIVYQALEKGLGIMREQGLVKKYYRQVKFFPTDLPNWKIID